MGFKDNMQMVKYARHAQKLQEANKFILSNADLKCKYCEKVFEDADNVQAVEYLDHLINEHHYIIDIKIAQTHKDKLERIFKKGVFSTSDDS